MGAVAGWGLFCLLVILRPAQPLPLQKQSCNKQVDGRYLKDDEKEGWTGIGPGWRVLTRHVDVPVISGGSRPGPEPCAGIVFVSGGAVDSVGGLALLGRRPGEGGLVLDFLVRDRLGYDIFEKL